MKNLHLLLVLFSIASMFTSFGVYDVDAAHDNKNGNAKAKNFDKDNNTNKVKNNPHCNGGNASTTTQFTVCDGNENGSRNPISDSELKTYIKRTLTITGGH